MKRVYIATSVKNVPAAKRLASTVRATGHSVVSRWHDKDNADAADHLIKDREILAENNYADLMNAGVFILLIHPECRGSIAEFGMAYCTGQTIFVVGEKSHITLMTYQRGVKFVADVSDVVAWLKKQE